ncbi:hypothetical protein KEM52_002604 [Ascosphaera acerosa]|nr:hypothetical protein KEM52_002604 [Ascosphaera acerosa]
MLFGPLANPREFFDTVKRCRTQPMWTSLQLILKPEYQVESVPETQPALALDELAEDPADVDVEADIEGQNETEAQPEADTDNADQAQHAQDLQDFHSFAEEMQRSLDIARNEVARGNLAYGLKYREHHRRPIERHLAERQQYLASRMVTTWGRSWQHPATMFTS